MPDLSMEDIQRLLQRYAFDGAAALPADQSPLDTRRAQTAAEFVSDPWLNGGRPQFTPESEAVRAQQSALDAAQAREQAQIQAIIDGRLDEERRRRLAGAGPAEVDYSRPPPPVGDPTWR